MSSMRQVIAETIELERLTMALYARFSARFADDASLREFWFGMARDEAQHLAALELAATVLERDGKLDQPSLVPMSDVTLHNLREMLGKFHRLPLDELTVEAALRIAVEIEESELEDLVAGFLDLVEEKSEYERCKRLLVHNLGDLSYMIERYCRDQALLERCDALCDRHVESLARRLPS